MAGTKYTIPVTKNRNTRPWHTYDAQAGEHAKNALHRNNESADPNGEKPVDDEDVVSMGRTSVRGLDPDLGFLHLWETPDRFQSIPCASQNDEGRMEG